MTTKLILTNESALRAKYGKRCERVIRALESLALADKKRGISTKIVRLDVAADLSAFRARAVRAVADQRATKDAVDALWRALRPEYLLLLGAPDVVAQQELGNTIPGDEDVIVPSDLPYACDALASRDPHDFTAPTRVVGRLPDITGDDDPAALLGALSYATTWQPRSRREYADCLAVSVEGWVKSTQLSLQNAFGNERDPELVPPKKFRWSPAQMGRLTHYFNCHGVEGESEFEGESEGTGKADVFPTAHSAPYVADKIVRGTIASVECCYGAQLYAPRQEQSFPPMVNTYLRHGAYAYFGSSTATFGSSDMCAGADLICSSFLRHVLSGASTGRAALQARHDYLFAHPTLEPADLKTLAQFALFGDPSIHPVIPQGNSFEPAAGRRASKIQEQLALGRSERRVRLVAQGKALHESSTITRPALQLRTPPAVRRALLAAVKKAGGSKPTFSAYRLEERAPAGKLRRLHRVATRSVHTALTQVGQDPRGRPRRVLFIAREQHGQVVSIRQLHTKS